MEAGAAAETEPLLPPRSWRAARGGECVAEGGVPPRAAPAQRGLLPPSRGLPRAPVSRVRLGSTSASLREEKRGGAAAAGCCWL